MRTGTPERPEQGPSRWHAGRRALGTRALRWSLCLSALSVAGCGFHLRGAQSLGLESVALQGFAGQSAQASSLRQAFARSGVRLKPAAEAEVTLVAYTDQRERTVLATSASGLVRELELRVRLSYSAQDAQGREWLPTQELLQTRTLTYQERDALAKEQEQEGLYRAMHDDITAQVLRRLAARRPAN